MSNLNLFPEDNVQDKSEALDKAIKAAVFLIKQKNCTLKHAVKSAAHTHDYKPMSHIEKGVREIIPAKFFIDRQKANRPARYN